MNNSSYTHVRGTGAEVTQSVFTSVGDGPVRNTHFFVILWNYHGGYFAGSFSFVRSHCATMGMCFELCIIPELHRPACSGILSFEV